MASTCLALVALLLLAGALEATASSGDASADFRSCVAECSSTGCLPAASPQATRSCPAACQKPPLPWALALFRWSCLDDCRYSCMWAREEAKRRTPTPSYPSQTQLPPVEKYFGKWPFQRVAGMQEVVSVAASLANLAAHLWCIARFWAFLRRPGGISSTSRPLQLSASSLHHQQQYRQHVGSGGPAAGTGEVALHLQPPGSPGGAHTTTTRAGASSPGADAHHRGAASEPARYPFRFLWTAYALLHFNAWIWSALFHCRDTRLTERLDYCSAVGLVAFGLGAAAWRVLWGRGRGRRIGAAATCAAVAVGFVRHMRYMLYVKFDYGYNMKACVAAGVLTAMLWVAWVTLVRHPGRRRMYLFICMVHAAMLLELFDFPPLVWHLVDAHAAWHVATVPLTPLFYAWLQSDAAMVLGAAEEQGKRKAT